MKVSSLIYLISLKNDLQRREKLKKQFPNTYEKLVKIDAVDGRIIESKEYYKYIYPFFVKYNRIMLPAELGCSLSHIKALEFFLTTSESFALIIEDDIIGREEDIEAIFGQIDFLDENSILFCGCQDGLMNRYKYGYKVPNSKLLKVPYSIRGNFSRTAAYLVSRNIAYEIIKFHKNTNITVADYWFDILNKANVNIYYQNVLSHPIDLTNSIIEQERNENSKSFYQKVFSKNVFKLVFHRLINELKLYFYLICGAKNIDDIK